MIVSFGDKLTEALYHGGKAKDLRKFLPDLRRTAEGKLDMLNAARMLTDLRSPPANHLEALKADLKGFYSIRVNDQWRIVFKWQGSDALDVRVTDYH